MPRSSVTTRPDEIATTPSGTRIHFNPRNHRYKIGRDAGSLSYVPSVSTILSDTIPKSLSGWAERGAVEGVLELLRKGGLVGELWDAAATDRVLRQMACNGLRHWQRRDAAADRGTNVHTAFEDLADGKIPKLSRFPTHERGYVQGVCAWWAEHEPKVTKSELMVASLEHGYAGRMDLAATTDEGETLIDLKTSRSVRESHHFQLAGYSIAFSESGHGDVDATAILRVASDGTFEYVKSWAKPSQFLALLESFRAQRQFKSDTPDEHKTQRRKAA